MKRLLRYAPLAGILFGCAILTFFAQAAKAATLGGLILCAQVVVPSLFPLCVLANLSVELGYADALGRLLGGLMPRLFGVTPRGVSALLLGLVGGFPVGAQTVCELYRHGEISKRDAISLSAFCNNAGPAFVLGAAGLTLFGSALVGLLLLVIQFSAAVLTGMLLRRSDAPHLHVRRLPDTGVQPFSSAFASAVVRAGSSLFQVCCFVVFFNLCLQLAAPIFARFGTIGAALAAGVLELTGGVLRLQAAPQLAQFICVSVLLGWSGLCVHAQALSALRAAALPCSAYFRGKLLQALVSGMLSVPIALALYGGKPLALIGLGLVPAIYLLFKKRGRNPEKAVI